MQAHNCSMLHIHTADYKSIRVPGTRERTDVLSKATDIFCTFADGGDGCYTSPDVYTNVSGSDVDGSGHEAQSTREGGTSPYKECDILFLTGTANGCRPQRMKWLPIRLFTVVKPNH